jgi:hypothetical protein
MNSNKYLINWEKNYKNSDSNNLKQLKKLDRAIDKINTEKKAKKIFRLGQLGQLVIMTPINSMYLPRQYVIINGYIIFL